MNREEYIEHLRREVFDGASIYTPDGYLLGYRDGAINFIRRDAVEKYGDSYTKGWEDGYGDLRLAELYVCCDL